VQSNCWLLFSALALQGLANKHLSALACSLQSCSGSLPPYGAAVARKGDNSALPVSAQSLLGLEVPLIR